MVKKELIDYIKEHQNSFTDEELKTAVLNHGYTVEEFEEAKKAYLGGNDTIPTSSPKSNPPSSPPASAQTKQPETIDNTPFKGKFKLAAICGITFWLFLILIFVVPDVLKSSAAILWAASGLIFFYGLYTLGKKYNNTLLKIAVILILIAFLIIIVASVFWVAIAGTMVTEINETMNLTALSMYNESQLSMYNGSQMPVGEEVALTPEMDLFITQIMEIMFTVLILGIFTYLINLVVLILVGVGLVRLRDNVKLSMPAGILTIIAAILPFLFILFFIAWILEIIILFNEANK